MPDSAADGSGKAADVLTRTLAAEPRLAGGRLLTIDGRAGSGKTTLAGQVAGAAGDEGVDCRVVHLDDLYDGWAGLRGVETRLEQDLLGPLSEGRSGRYRRYDWHLGRFAEWIAVAPSRLLIVEGVGSGHRDLDRFRSLLVWVEAPADVGLSRGLARDGESMRQEWLAWQVAESAYFTEQALPERADLIVSGT